MIGQTNAQIVSGGTDIPLIKQVVTDSAYSSNASGILSTFFSDYSATSSLWVIIAENNASVSTSAFMYLTGSTIAGNNYAARVARRNGVYGSEYSVAISAGTTLSLYAISYNDKLPS